MEAEKRNQDSDAEAENKGQDSETEAKDRNQDSEMEAAEQDSGIGRFPAKTGDSRADRGTNRRPGRSGSRFGLGVVVGLAAAVLILAGAWGAGRITGLIRGGNFASGTVSKADVEDKLDLLNGLIESITCMKMRLIQMNWSAGFILVTPARWAILTPNIMTRKRLLL